MSKNLTVVCGGRGFVGSALIADLKRKGETEIRCVSRGLGEPWEMRDGVEYVCADLMDPKEALGAVRDARFVYNLAASVGGIDYIQANRARCMLAAKINLNLLEACAHVGVQRYFFASSACVYSSNDFPCAENYTIPANPERGYGQDKLFGEWVCREFRESGLVETRVARLFTLFGGGDKKDHPHFPSAICRKIAKAKLLGQDRIEVWGDGTQVRSLLHIRDAVEGIQRIMHSGVVGPVNLSCAEHASVLQMTDMVQTIAGTDLLVNLVPGTVGVLSRYSDNSLIRRELGWEPSTSLKEGLSDTFRYEWDQALKCK